jgi:hypothetical protein
MKIKEFTVLIKDWSTLSSRKGSSNLETSPNCKIYDCKSIRCQIVNVSAAKLKDWYHQKVLLELFQWMVMSVFNFLCPALGDLSPSVLKELTLWTRRAASKFPCLTIDGNADSRGTSAVFQTVTLFYAVCTIFPSKSFVFDQIK